MLGTDLSCARMTWRRGHAKSLAQEFANQMPGFFDKKKIFATFSTDNSSWLCDLY
jgi:hypothetical protein